MNQPAAPESCACWGLYGVKLRGPADGNPFTDVDLAAVFDDGEREMRVGGFYNGDGAYRVRFLPGRERMAIRVLAEEGE